MYGNSLGLADLHYFSELKGQINAFDKILDLQDFITEEDMEELE